MEATVKLPLEGIEPALARLWEDEARQSGAPRIELLTLVAVVTEPSLLDRALRVVDAFASSHPARTIVATHRPGAQAAIEAEVSLHRVQGTGAACGDAIILDATGEGRQWLPENIDRLALPDLPVCLWWVGDLPDFDQLFDRALAFADWVVVNSGEMDLRDLERLSEVGARSHDRYSLSDLTWHSLRPMQDLVARFFDDAAGRACIAGIRRLSFSFVARRPDAPGSNDGQPHDDVTSTEAGLMLGWMAQALKLPIDAATWKRGSGWAEVTLGPVSARFEARSRADVPCGALLALSLECDEARFAIERLDDPCVVRWSREVPGAPMPPQTLRIAISDESSMLVRSLAQLKRDPLLEATLRAASRIVRPVAPRLATP